MTLAGRYAAIVCDLDGVVYRGPVAVPHAVESLTAVGLSVQYATNNASRPPATVAAHLTSLGLDVAEEAVTTASQAGAWVLSGRIDSGARVLAVGGAGVASALREHGFDVLAPGTPGPSDPVPAAVLQGYGPMVSAADLGEAAYAIEGGAFWVATNTDATLPTDRGVAPGNGALVSAVELAVGRSPDAVAGKPHPPLYRLCADRLGVPVERILAVGDRLETDIEGAVRTGMDSVHVLTGVHTLRDVVLADRSRRPTFVVPDLRALCVELAVPTVEDGWGTCGGRRRRVGASGWSAEGEGGALADLNAVVRALHAALDAGTLRAEDLDAVWPDALTVLRAATDE
jgi:HAD superfamily hydrolase (TIGR01450 family)